MADIELILEIGVNALADPRHAGPNAHGAFRLPPLPSGL